MNLPEEAAVLLYQADATAGPASSWSHSAHCGAGRGFDCFKRHEKSGAIGEQHGLHCQPGGVLCGSAPDLQKGIRLHPLWPAGENCPQRLPPVICWNGCRSVRKRKYKISGVLRQNTFINNWLRNIRNLSRGCHFEEYIGRRTKSPLVRRPILFNTCVNIPMSSQLLAVYCPRKIHTCACQELQTG